MEPSSCENEEKREETFQIWPLWMTKVRRNDQDMMAMGSNVIVGLKCKVQLTKS